MKYKKTIGRRSGSIGFRRGIHMSARRSFFKRRQRYIRASYRGKASKYRD